jgi:type IV secretion system protein VirD4
MAEGKGSENLWLGVIAVGAAMCMAFWLVGTVAAAVASNPQPGASLAEMPGVIISLITNPADPASAWPVQDQASIPGPFTFYLTLAGLIFLFAVAAMGGYKLWQEYGPGGSGKGNGLGSKSTQWAKRGDIRPLIVREPTPGRLILGSVSGALVATEQRHSVIVMGPTQSGKTTGLAVPSILEWQGPVIATSVKNDLSQDTLGWRERMGRVWVYDPTATSGLEASTWSPLDGAREWAGAKKIAAWLTSASKAGGKGGLQDGDFWYSAAGKLMAPHLFAAAANGYSMADVVRWIDTQEEFEVRSLLQATGVEEAITAAEASWQREDRARSSIYTTAEVVIDAYSDPTVLESARTSDINSRQFFDGNHNTVYVCAPSHEQDRLRPVFSTLLKQFITAAYDFGKRLDPPLLIVLDEAANIAPLDNLDTIASTCSGLGIQLVTVWQDLSQINAKYGDRANTVVNNHRAKIVLAGISDPSTLDYVSRLVGSEEVSQTSTTFDGQGSKSRTVSKGDKNLAPSDVVRRIQQNEGLLIYGGLLPARLRLRPWYRSKRLTAMVKNDVVEVRAQQRQAQGQSGKGGSGTSSGGNAADGDYRSKNSGGDDYRRSSPLG